MCSIKYKPDVNHRDFRDQSFVPMGEGVFKYFTLDPRTLVLVSIPLIISMQIFLRV